MGARPRRWGGHPPPAHAVAHAHPTQEDEEAQAAQVPQTDDLRPPQADDREEQEEGEGVPRVGEGADARRRSVRPRRVHRRSAGGGAPGRVGRGRVRGGHAGQATLTGGGAGGAWGRVHGGHGGQGVLTGGGAGGAGGAWGRVHAGPGALTGGGAGGAWGRVHGEPGALTGGGAGGAWTWSQTRRASSADTTACGEYTSAKLNVFTCFPSSSCYVTLMVSLKI